MALTGCAMLGLISRSIGPQLLDFGGELVAFGFESHGEGLPFGGLVECLASLVFEGLQVGLDGDLLLVVHAGSLIV